MKRKSLHRTLFLTYVAVILAAIMLIGLLTALKVRSSYLARASLDLEAIAGLVMRQIAVDFQPEYCSQLDSVCKVLGEVSKSRITFIHRSGMVLGDSHENPQNMENHADRPEIKNAIAQGEGISTRMSPTLDKLMLYYAIPLVQEGEMVGTVRVSVAIADIGHALREVYLWTIVAGLIIAVLAVVVSYKISRGIASRVEEMRRGAESFALGSFDNKVPISNITELASLADALNQMASQLSLRIETVTRQRNELDSVLAAMAEGVLSFDLEARLLSLNQAAADILEIDKSDSMGRLLQETVRNPDLREFVIEVLKEPESLEREIVMKNGMLYLQAHGNKLRDAQGSDVGALIVLHDITSIKKMEKMRSEFVANVSHELRTPITAIKGFVETLLDGAVEDPESAAKFLKITCQHIDRLTEMTQSLLSLSKIERDVETKSIKLEVGDVTAVLSAAAESCKKVLMDKNVRLIMDTPGELKAKINPPLLEQAIVNLIDNAVKFSEPESEIKIGTEVKKEEIAIYVQDFGWGIEVEHLERIFERFYRVESDRNRKTGGAGLGLSIVKHIVLAHNGRVEAESRIGQGAVLRIYLPKID